MAFGLSLLASTGEIRLAPTKKDEARELNEPIYSESGHGKEWVFMAKKNWYAKPG